MRKPIVWLAVAVCAAALKFRAFELYGWHPIEKASPTKPPRYPPKTRPVAQKRRISKGQPPTPAATSRMT